jgi:hypothetical protein
MSLSETQPPLPINLPIKTNVNGYQIPAITGKDDFKEINLLRQNFLEKHNLIFYDDPANGY